jgi:tetratricopeptide (TPR) repeat protein
MASEFIQTGKYEEAISVLKQVPRNSSTYPNALVLLGDAQYYLANYDAANSVYDEAISINSNYFEAWWGKGYALYELGMKKL